MTPHEDLLHIIILLRQTQTCRQANLDGPKYSRLDADISAMQRSSSTYCDQPEDSLDFEAWLKACLSRSTSHSWKDMILQSQSAFKTEFELQCNCNTCCLSCLLVLCCCFKVTRQGPMPLWQPDQGQACLFTTRCLLSEHRLGHRCEGRNTRKRILLSCRILIWRGGQRT